MKTYTIRELSELLGLPASTLRYYEEIGLLPGVIHTAGGKRLYTQEQIDRLNGILCFKRTGLPISKIQDFFRCDGDIPGHIDEIVALVTSHERSICEQIARMESDLAHIRQKVRYYTAVRDALRAGQPLPRWEDYAQEPAERKSAGRKAAKNRSVPAASV